MISQPHLPGSRERRVTVALAIGLVVLFFVACWEDKASTKTDETQKKTSTGEETEKLRLGQHDIPPEIAIDVGSFSIETDVDIRESGAPKKGKYKVSGKHVSMMLIKIIRTDDGAVLYQNFAPDGVSLEFTTNTFAGTKKVTVTPGQVGGKKTLDFETTDGDFTYSPANHPTRTHRLSGGYAIMSLAITKPNDSTKPPSTTTLFSHDTSSASAEYPDRRYRVLIRVEKKT